MADPLTAGLMLAGGGVGAAGELQSGRTAAAAGRKEAGLQEINREYLLRAADREAERNRRVSRQTIGAQRAAAAASGRSFTGSSLDIATSSLSDAAAQINEILFQGEIQGFGARTQGSFAKFTGNQKNKQAKYAAASTLMKSFSGAASAGGY